MPYSSSTARRAGASPPTPTVATMTAAQVARPGAAHFQLVSVPVPEPGPGQVLIKVHSAGVNFSDLKRRRGDPYPFETEFPYVPGGEIAGEIVAHGPGVEGPPVGTRVFALAGASGTGGYAQFAVSYAQTAIPIPDGLNNDVASVLMIAGSTAQLMLHHVARLQPGEAVWIPAATGGVGSFAMQIARLAGAGQIIAGVGHSSKRDAAIALGAHDVVVYDNTHWPERVRALTKERGVDVALDANGGESADQTLRCLAPFARMVVYGAAAGTSVGLSVESQQQWLYTPAPNQMVTGFNVGGWFQARPAIAAEALTALVTAVLRQQVRVPEITTLRLSECARAHQLLERRSVRGKLVIKPWA